MIFSTYQIIFFIIIGIIFTMTTLIIFASNSKPGSFLDRVTNKIPTISTFIIAMGIIITYQLYTVTFISNRKQSTYTLIDRSFTNIIKVIDDYYDKCPEFINSLFFPWQKQGFPSAKPNLEINSDRWTSTLYVANLIFQSWEDFLTDLKTWTNMELRLQYNEDDERSWLALFLGWAQSKELQEIFESQKLDYNITTERFAYLMFEYLEKYPNIKTVEELDELTIKIFNDPRYESIKEDIHS